MNKRYILEVGEAGAERLQLIHRVYGPATEALLLRIGIKPGMTIADIGCGIGTVSTWLAHQVGPTGTVWCVDNSCEQLEMARSSALDGELTNVRFLESSADTIGLPADSIDMTYCRFLLDHLTDPGAAIEQMRRILKPRGVLVTETIDFTGMTSDPPQPVYVREIEHMREMSEQRGVDAGSGLKVHRLYRSSGFTHVNVSLNQPAYLTGEGKHFWEYSIAESANIMVSLGLATVSEVQQRLCEMRQVNLDDSILVALPRSVQVWARK